MNIKTIPKWILLVETENFTLITLILTLIMKSIHSESLKLNFKRFEVANLEKSTCTTDAKALKVKADQ